jgi:dipeptidyl aminopeptidase/acylaminoacyl peptidase
MSLQARPRGRRWGSTTAVSLMLAVVVSVFAGTARAGEGRRLTLDDIGSEIGIDEIAISPDGRRIAVVTSRADYVDNRYVKSLLLVDSITGVQSQPVPNRQQVGAPQWSPGGDRLAYLDTEGSGVTQLYVLSDVGGEARALRVTDVPRSVGSFRWSPDGAQIAFRMADAPPARSGEERHNASFEAGEGDYLARSTPVPSQVWLVPSVGGEARRLTSGVQSVIDMAWAGDGRSIAVVAQPTAYFTDFRNKSLSRIDVSSGAVSVIDPGPKAFDHTSMLRTSPDGREISYQYYPGPETLFHPTRLELVPFVGGKARVVSPDVDRTVLSHAWAGDGRSLVVTGVDRTRHVAWLQPLEGTARRIELGAVTALSSLVSSHSGALAFVGSEPQKAPEVYFMTSAGAKPKRLTGFNDRYARFGLGRVETIVWQGPDGFTLDGVVVYPPGFVKGEKAPLVLNIHGGPMFSSTESWDAFSQLMAAQGWIVFAPNYRGSTSTGKKLQTAIINDAGDGPGRDVMSGIEALKARGIVDDSHMAVSGWSYGGYMTAWLIGNYQVWKAAVAGATVTDWMDYYNTSDANVWAGYGVGGSPWREGQAANYWRQSPIAHAHEAKTPTLILANAGDRRVTISQSYKLYHALKDNSVEVAFVAYPVDAHVPVDPVHERDIRRRWVDWIERHLRAVR